MSEDPVVIATSGRTPLDGVFGDVHRDLSAPARVAAAVTAERAFFALAGVAWIAKVLTDAGAPRALLTVALVGAAMAAVAAVVMARRRPRPVLRWLDGWRLPLALLALWMVPSVYGLIGGDGYEYYALLRSPIIDHDLDFRNDFAGLGAQPVLSAEGEVTARTPIGTALLWLPSFLAAHALATAVSWMGGGLGNDGFDVLYQSAATSTSYAAGVLALVLIEAALRRRHTAALALVAVLALWLATPLHFYMVANPFMSHAASVLAATLLTVGWLRARRAPSVRAWAGVGAAGALLALVRVQDAVLLLPVLVDLLLGPAGGATAEAAAGAAPPSRLRLVSAFLALPLAAGLLQLLVWVSLYGRRFLGVVLAENLVGGEAHVLDVLFAARHGLFTWTPLYLLCALGWLLLARREGRLALVCLSSFALAVVVNAHIQDWWGSHAFGQRRLLCLTPLFALGLGRVLALLAARPLLAAGALLAPLALWTAQFEYLFNSEVVAGKGQAVTMEALVPAQVEALYWKLLRMEDTLPRPLFVLAYDNLKGVWLDEGPRSLRGRVDLGSEPPELPQLVGHNWYRPQQEGETTFRRSKGRRSWLRVPVRTPGGFGAVLRARSDMGGVPVTVAVEWNGREVGTATLGDEWAEHAFTVPAEAVRAGFNDVALRWSTSPRSADPGYHGLDSAAVVDWLRLDRRFEGPLQRHR